MIQAGIVGATGYTGFELIRLLSSHPHVRLTHFFARQAAGKTVAQVFPEFIGKYAHVLLPFVVDPYPDLDVLFLAMPHGEAQKVVGPLLEKNPQLKIVDLSADFRLKDPAQFEAYYGEPHSAPEWMPQFVTGFTELVRDPLKGARLCANPGCYPTCTVLTLYPLAQKGMLQGAVVDAKSGVSGAGKTLKESSLYCEANEAVRPYGTGAHRHQPEIDMMLNTPVFFSPHLVPMSRGMLVSAYIPNPSGISQQELMAVYTAAYANEPFVFVTDTNGFPSTRWVVGSNRCVIVPKAFPSHIAVFGVIDNLIKGASGQAIQNMNVMFGLEETMGLSELPKGV